MKFVKYLFVSLFLAVGMTANAQATYTAADGTEYQFKKHAFLNLEGGVQETLGEAKFSDLLSPNVQLGLGYQFSPVFGMRLQANGWQSKGGFNQEANVTYKYKYVVKEDTAGLSMYVPSYQVNGDTGAVPAFAGSEVRPARRSG